MKKSTKVVVGVAALAGAWLLWERRVAVATAATAAYERASGTAPPAPPDMGAPGHHAGGSARGPHRPGHGGGGGSTVIYGGPWDYEDPYAEALRLALALEQGRGRSRNA